MAGRVANWVGLRFDDTAARSSFEEIVDEDLADEVARQLDGVDR